MTSFFEHVISDLLDSGLAVRFRAAGVSMEPTIRDGEELLVERGAKVRRGQVVLFREPQSGRLLAHRVVAIRRDGSVIVRGDAAHDSEGPVDPATILGRVIGVERAGHWRPIDSLAVRLHLVARRIRMRLRR